MARYLIVDVFTEEPLAGNALAVFPDPGSIEPARMQRIAREMNLSETTFVTATRPDGYDVRIFTPTDELPFAGHPTIGTAWTLRHLGAIDANLMTQRSAAGETPVSFDGSRTWLERSGTVSSDVDASWVADQLGVDVASIGAEAGAFGAAETVLMPAMSDAGVPQLMVPFRDVEAIASLRAPAAGTPAADGVYCFAAAGDGRVKARFFASGIGVVEDPATGSAAAALGLYLGARAGACSIEITQGEEIARPSTLFVEAENGRARVGGAVRLVAEGTFYD